MHIYLIHVPVSWKTIEEKLFLTCVFNLVCSQQMSICPVKDRCLHVSGCGKSVVDYICLSNCMRTNVNCIEVVDEHPCNLSHHLPLIVKINVDGDITDEKIFSKSAREYERIAWRKCTLEHYSEF